MGGTNRSPIAHLSTAIPPYTRGGELRPLAALVIVAVIIRRRTGDPVFEASCHVCQRERTVNSDPRGRAARRRGFEDCEFDSRMVTFVRAAEVHGEGQAPARMGAMCRCNKGTNKGWESIVLGALSGECTATAQAHTDLGTDVRKELEPRTSCLEPSVDREPDHRPLHVGSRWCIQRDCQRESNCESSDPIGGGARDAKDRKSASSTLAGSLDGSSFLPRPGSMLLPASSKPVLTSHVTDK